MRCPVILSVLLLAVLVPSTPVAAATPTLPELFVKAKEQVKLGSYETALSTLQEIDTASQQPGLEKDREALQPSLAFYRGVCHAALGKDNEAQGEFRAYLEAAPNASLDPAAYPKKVVAAFQEAQKTMAPAPQSDSKGGIATAYLAFRKPADDPRKGAGEDWADGPVRFLLTAAQASEYRHLPDSISRSEFITNFWKARDPKPETPENEFREEFERRVAFADLYFVQGETRGSFTDRGTVFVLLGPPSSSSQRPMKTGDDTGDPAAMSLSTPGQVQEAAIGGKTTGSRSAQIARVDATSGVGTSVNQPSSNWREVWRYMRKILPGKLPYEWVDFDFITRPGYGEAVLQRDPAVLDAMDHAKSAMRNP